MDLVPPVDCAKMCVVFLYPISLYVRLVFQTRAGRADRNLSILRRAVELLARIEKTSSYGQQSHEHVQCFGCVAQC